MATISSQSEGTLVKPNTLKGNSIVQSMWVIGESLRGRTRGDSELPVTAAVPESEVCASTFNGDPIQVASVVSLPVKLKGDQLDEVASAMEVSKFGFIGEAVTNRGKGDENHTPMAGDLSVGTTARLMGLGNGVSSDHRHQCAAQNHFFPLSSLGSEKGLCFGERDNSTVVLGEKGEKWSNPIVEPVSLSYLDRVELLQEGSEHFLL